MSTIKFIEKYGWDIARNQLNLRKYDNTVFFYEDFVVDFEELSSILDAKATVDIFYGLKKCRSLVKGNTLDASYVSRDGDYYRYGAYDVFVVINGKYEIVHGGLDSTYLTHIETLKSSIKIMEQFEGNEFLEY